MFRLSIAMTTYNGEKYIEKQLLSLKEQIRRPDEVIIVDDCSTDRTVEIAENFINDFSLAPDWKIIRNEENLGFKRNFKKVLSLVSGDIIFLCDQDDIWCEDKLETVAGLFTAYPDMLAVNSSFAVIDSNGDPHPFEKKRGKSNYGFIDFTPAEPFCKIPLHSVFHKNISPGCTVAVKSEIAKRYVEESDCVLPHDHELNLLAAANDGLWFYNTCLIKYRLHENNTIGFTVKPQSRIEIAEEKSAAAKAANYDGKYVGLCRMCDARLNALKKIDLIKTLKLWLLPDYYRFFPFKERVGDLLYIFGRR